MVAGQRFGQRFPSPLNTYMLGVYFDDIHYTWLVSYGNTLRLESDKRIESMTRFLQNSVRWLGLDDECALSIVLEERKLTEREMTEITVLGMATFLFKFNESENIRTLEITRIHMRDSIKDEEECEEHVKTIITKVLLYAMEHRAIFVFAFLPKNEKATVTLQYPLFFFRGKQCLPLKAKAVDVSIKEMYDLMPSDKDCVNIIPKGVAADVVVTTEVGVPNTPPRSVTPNNAPRARSDTPNLRKNKKRTFDNKGYQVEATKKPS